MTLFGGGSFRDTFLIARRNRVILKNGNTKLNTLPKFINPLEDYCIAKIYSKRLSFPQEQLLEHNMGTADIVVESYLCIGLDI